MTKDARPSLLNDIRYFYGASRLEHSYLKDHEDAVAFGRRIALFLNSTAISLGAYTALYLQFNPNLPAGKIEITDDGGEWWQRYAHIGVPKNFLEMPNVFELVTDGTIKALKALRPQSATEIDEAAKIVLAQGEHLRFLAKIHLSKRYKVEVSFNIAEWKKTSYLYVGLTDRLNDDYLEAAPLPLKFYQDIFHLAGSIKITGSVVSIIPKSSSGAQFTADVYRDRLSNPILDFTQTHQKPILTEIIKLRG